MNSNSTVFPVNLSSLFRSFRGQWRWTFLRAQHYFCASYETVTYLVNNNIHRHANQTQHPHASTFNTTTAKQNILMLEKLQKFSRYKHISGMKIFNLYICTRRFGNLPNETASYANAFRGGFGSATEMFWFIKATTILVS